jgi:hypothetical protein
MTETISLRYRPELHFPMVFFGGLTTWAGFLAGGLIDLALIGLSGGRIVQNTGQAVGMILGAMPPAIAILIDALTGQACRYDKRDRDVSLEPVLGPVDH